MFVPLTDLRVQYLSIKGEIDAAVARVLAKGSYVMGEEVEAFEAEWAAFCQAKHCIGVSSGTDALRLVFLALKALRIRDPSRTLVTTTPRTFFATAEAPRMAGFEKVAFVDSGADLLHEKILDVEREGSTPTPWRERVHIAVHLYGASELAVQPQPYVRSKALVIEDSSHAHGLPLRGFAACFSHYPTKNLGANGQAGSIVTNDDELARALRQLRVHGEAGGRRFFHEQVGGGNARLDEMQAAILRAKLPHLPAWNKRRQKIARRYTEELSPCKPVLPPIDVPSHAYHIYAIGITGGRRGSLRNFLDEKVQTAVRYPYPLHRLPPFFGARCLTDMEGAERWAQEALSLPIYPEMTDDQVTYVIEQVIAWTKTQP